MRFSVRKEGKFFKIWDECLNGFYRISGNEVQYKTERKAKYRCGLCNNNWRMPDMNKIELLLAWEDGTWTTKVYECPESLDRANFTAVCAWANTHLASEEAYEGVILFAVYNTDPESDDGSSNFPELT